ncbi:MAG: alanine--glyoxylate aminotransferase family protein [Bacteroidales bacterium]|nr:alanine--glyoxylate aminotransferase family protein [Bacteroidales bacterium]
MKRKLLMIPGPIEFDSEVMDAMSVPTPSHVAADFIESFGNSLEMMRQVWMCPSGQPFVVAGTGTLAMDIAGSNLIEPGDNALVISTGYFGQRFANLLKRYGAKVTLLTATLGNIVPLEDIEDALRKKKYKLMTFTHVDTSTAVMNDPKPIGALGKKYDVLTILDGVCSVAGEEIKQEEWGIDMVLTASQKAVGVPPGLALLVVSQKAMAAWKNRSEPVGNYYADWENWLPIMEAYMQRKPSYFGTPAVNLILALEKSLQLILKEGMEQRIKRHQNVGHAFRAGLKSLGLKTIPVSESVAANTLSAPYFPENIAGQAILSGILNEGVIVAGGLLPELKSSYFRVGHMGITAKNEVITTLKAIETSLIKQGLAIEKDVCLKTALEIL